MVVTVGLVVMVSVGLFVVVAVTISGVVLVSSQRILNDIALTQMSANPSSNPNVSPSLNEKLDVILPFPYKIDSCTPL
jgi:hypothetical protein